MASLMAAFLAIAIISVQADCEAWIIVCALIWSKYGDAALPTLIVGSAILLPVLGLVRHFFGREGGERDV